MIEDDRSSSQVGRLLGSGINIHPITSLNSFENLPGSGGYCAYITFLNNPFISEALKGGLIAAISYSTQPRDQMSLLKLYGLSYQTSGEA